MRPASHHQTVLAQEHDDSLGALERLFSRARVDLNGEGGNKRVLRTAGTCNPDKRRDRRDFYLVTLIGRSRPCVKLSIRPTTWQAALKLVWPLYIWNPPSIWLWLQRPPRVPKGTLAFAGNGPTAGSNIGVLARSHQSLQGAGLNPALAKPSVKTARFSLRWIGIHSIKLLRRKSGTSSRKRIAACRASP